MKKIINIYLASPRGFCAGVKRAIEIVELALQKYGPPIYVRHEIVHNKRVVQELSKKGAVFVEELEEIPLGSRVIFSAHGVSKKIKKVAKDYIQLSRHIAELSGLKFRPNQHIICKKECVNKFAFP